MNQISEQRQAMLDEKRARLRFLNSKGVIHTQEFKGGNLMDYGVREFMFDYNMDPQINDFDKYWRLKKVLKTQTWSVHWLIQINGKYFEAIQCMKYQAGQVVYFYPCDEKGKSRSNTAFDEIYGYMDLESACDIFANRYMFNRFAEGKLENVNLPFPVE